MDTYKIIITVAGLSAAFLLSVVAELLCKAQTARRASGAQRRKSPEAEEGAETPEDKTSRPCVSQGSQIGAAP